MIAIADILQAGEKLTAVAPFLAGIQNEEQLKILHKVFSVLVCTII